MNSSPDLDIPFTLAGLQKAGMTQTQIGAELGGLAQSTISDMANGKAGVIRPTYAVVKGLMRLAKEYKVPTGQTPP